MKNASLRSYRSLAHPIATYLSLFSGCSLLMSCGSIALEGRVMQKKGMQQVSSFPSVLVSQVSIPQQNAAKILPTET